MIKFITTFKGNGTTYYKFSEPNNKKLNKILVSRGCETAIDFIQEVCRILNSSTSTYYTIVGQGSYHFLGTSNSTYPLAVHSAPTSHTEDRLRIQIYKILNGSVTTAIT